MTLAEIKRMIRAAICAARMEGAPVVEVLRKDSASPHMYPLSWENVGGIYFVGFGDYVKIGFTSTPVQKRLAALQAECPEPLVVYASIPGTMRLERELHRRFAASRLQSEWFRKTPELLDYIESIKEISAQEAA